MEWDKYNVVKTYDDFSYGFDSEGPKGKIKKVVQFQRVEGLSPNFYNLFFGDVIGSSGKIDEFSVSNNNDRNKILLTIAAITHDFIQFRPNAIILAVGSTNVRTRLYQMSISAYWDEISTRYNVYGKLNEDWVCFEKSINFTGFLIFKKID